MSAKGGFWWDLSPARKRENITIVAYFVRLNLVKIGVLFKKEASGGQGVQSLTSRCKKRQMSI